MNAADAMKLAILLDRIQELAEAINSRPSTHGSNYLNSDRPFTLECEVGQRFIRLVTGTVEARDRSVHAFVDITNGDIIKSAGWKAPQKGKHGLAVRGNLLDTADFDRLLKVADRYGSYLYQR